MKKNLSAWGLLWISLTSMIGSGWLFGSLYSAQFAGPAAIIAWPLAGFLLLFLALSFAEVGTMFPHADILVRLPLYTHGRLTSVIMSYLAWVSLSIMPVIETQGLVQYASNYLPCLMIQEGVYYTSTPLGYLLTLLMLISFVLLNYFGVRFFARINASFTVWKVIIPSITVISLFCMSYNAKNFSQFGGFMPYGWQGIMTAISSGGVLFSLLGFRQVLIMMGEIENPGKYVPLVLLGSVVMTTILYTGLQWSFIGSLREQDLIHGWSKLSFIGDAGPFAAISALVGMIWLSMLLYVDAFVSPYSTGLVFATTSAQMLASMGEMGQAPQSLAIKNVFQAPWVSLLVNFLFSVVMFFVLRGWQAIAAFIVTVTLISYAVGPISLICLRKQLPHYDRPFRLRYSAVVAFLGFYICTAGSYWAGFMSVMKLLIFTFLGLIYYLFHTKFVTKSTHELDFKHALWLLGYIFGLGIFSYFGNYGGDHLIPQYWDLLYLMVFCLIIFALAVFSTKPIAYTQDLVSTAP